MPFIEKNTVITVQVLIAKITIFKSRFVVYALIKIAISIGFTANRCGIDTVQTNGRVIDQVAGSSPSPPSHGYIHINLIQLANVSQARNFLNNDTLKVTAR